MIPEFFKELIRRYSQSSLLQNIVTTISGTTIAQAIQVLAAPLLTLFYPAEQFGIFTLYFSVANSIAVIATMRYELAIMLPDNDDEAHQLIGASLGITLLLSIITFAVLFMTGKYVAAWLDVDVLSQYLLLAAFSVAGTGVFQTLTFSAMRSKQFKLVAAMRILQSLTFATFPIIFFHSGFITSGLVYGYVLSQLVTAALFVFIVFPKLILQLSEVSIKGMMAQMYRYRGFPGFNSLHAFTDMLQNSAINFLISIFYGQTALGFYAMAYRVLRAPLGVIGSAISQVLYQTMSENYNNRISNLHLFNQTVRYVAGISIPLFLFIAAVAPWSFKIVLGTEWYEAGWYVIFLTPLFMMTFITSPLSHLPNITGRQGKFLLYVSSVNIISLLAFSWVHFIYPHIYLSFLSYSLIWFAGYAFILMWLRKLAHQTLPHVVA